MLDKPKGHPLSALLEDGRKYEALAANKHCIKQLSTETSIGAIGTKQSECSKCGLNHPPKRCPAFKDTCKICKNKGHWTRMCSKGQRRQQPTNRGRRRGRSPHRKRYQGRSSRSRPPQDKKEVHEMSSYGYEGQATEDSDEQLMFYSIRVSDLCLHSTTQIRDEAFTVVDIICPEKVRQHRLRLKVDTGAGGNTLPLRTVKQMYNDKWRGIIQPTDTKLKAYNETTIPCLGYINIVCRYKDSAWKTEKFYVVDVPGPPVMGLPAWETLKIVTIHGVEGPTTESCPGSSIPHITSVKDLMNMYPDRFDRIGEFKGETTIHLKEGATPSIDAPRKFSVNLKPKLEQELKKMETQGVICKITHHTDWCSSITTRVKPDGSLHVCLDPKRLNNSIKRCPHKIPTLEELNPAFSKVQFFSKLDAKSGYWSVRLAKESQELTTFRTPIGKYCFQRLPFVLNISQDVFQQEMDRIVSQVPGCISIADDVAVVGETEEKHNRRLIQLMETARKEGLVFNSSKCTITTDKINFYWIHVHRRRKYARPLKSRRHPQHAYPTGQR